MPAEDYKVLIIDDSEPTTKLFEMKLKHTPFKVKTENDPVEAFELIQKENFNIVISDIQMPEMNGLELLKKIKNYNGMIQVVMITGYLTINNTIDAFRYGAENLFFKPLNMDEVIGGIDMCAAKLDRVNYLLGELKKGEQDDSSAKH